MKSKKYVIASGVLFILSTFFLYKGYDKMTNYYSSESFSSLNRNSYVGGDAYNYIINGTYSTSFFVLATMFSLLGMGCLILHYINKNLCNIHEKATIKDNKAEVHKDISSLIE